LRKPHPSEDRVDVWKTLSAACRVCSTDAARDALDSSVDWSLEAQQGRLHRIADMDVGEFRLLKIGIDLDGFSKYSHAVWLTNFPHLSQERLPAEGLRGTGGPQRPSRRSRGTDASPLRQKYFSQLRAMVLEDLQIAN